MIAMIYIIVFLFFSLSHLIIYYNEERIKYSREKYFTAFVEMKKAIY